MKFNVFITTLQFLEIIRSSSTDGNSMRSERSLKRDSEAFFSEPDQRDQVFSNAADTKGSDTFVTTATSLHTKRSAGVDAKGHVTSKPYAARPESLAERRARSNIEQRVDPIQVESQPQVVESELPRVVESDLLDNDHLRLNISEKQLTKSLASVDTKLHALKFDTRDITLQESLATLHSSDGNTKSQHHTMTRSAEHKTILILVFVVPLIIVAWIFQKPIEDKVMVGLPHCLTWLVCTSVMVLFNKWMFTKDGGNFPFVLTISTWHVMLCSIFTRCLLWLTPHHFAKAWMPAATQGLDLTWRKWALGALPLGMLMATSLWLGTLSYLLCTVSFMQLVKAGIGPMVACLFSFIARTEVFSLPLVQVIGIISVGDIIMFYSDIHHIPYGALVQLLCMLFEQCRLQLLQIFMSSSGNGSTKLDPLSALYVFAPSATFFVGLAAAVFEWHQQPEALLQRALHVGWETWLANGTVAILLNIISVMCISKVGALTFVIVGIVKDACLLTFDALIFHTHLAEHQIIGFVVCAMGVCMYSLYKCNRDTFLEKGLISGAAFIVDEAKILVQARKRLMGEKY